jgi:hypothetical protein
MIKSSNKYILFIEPWKGAATEPVQDELSAKMREAMAHAGRPNYSYYGYHQCVCGAKSDATDWILHTGQITNSLAVHYLEYHRDQVPLEELAKVRGMPPCEVDVIEIRRLKKEAQKQFALEMGWTTFCRSCGEPMDDTAPAPYCAYCGESRETAGDPV